jgi:hypothetical protein
MYAPFPAGGWMPSFDIAYVGAPLFILLKVVHPVFAPILRELVYVTLFMYQHLYTDFALR